MKKISIFCFICGLFLAVPGLVSAQPGPRGPFMAPPPPPPPPGHHHMVPPPPPPGHHHMMPPPPPAPGPTAMPRHEFDRLVQSLRHGGPHINRVARIRSAANYHWFTCHQVRVLMDHLMMESERVDAACSVQHRVLDPQNFGELHRALRDPRSHRMLDSCWHR